MNEDTLGTHVQRFLNVKHNHETRAWYAKYLAPMVEHLGETKPVNAITRADAEVYWQEVQLRKTCWETHPTKPTKRRPLSPTTLHNHLRSVRTFWYALVRQRVVEFNPFDHLTSPKDTRPVSMKAIAAEDLRALWQTALHSNKRDFAIITVIATTGMRAGELASMNLGQLDLRQGFAWVQGKRGWRKVFLGKSSVLAIQEYVQERTAGGQDATARAYFAAGSCGLDRL